MVRPFVCKSLFSYLSPAFGSVSAGMQHGSPSGRAGDDRLGKSWVTSTRFDVHGGHSSCGSVTGASRFLIGLVSTAREPRLPIAAAHSAVKWYSA
jgi:hypothetical protein